MKDKICLVTGANSGIGWATAYGLAQRQATVIMLCRDRQRGEAVRQEIIAQTKNQSVHLLVADLASIAETKAAAAELSNQFGRLHVLINNAAIIPAKRILTADALETQFAVNHLAYFILANALLPLLQANGTPTNPARIVNVSSLLHSSGVVDFDNLQSEKLYAGRLANGGAGWGVYCNTKLMNILFTNALARKLSQAGIDNVTVNSLHPGVIATNLTRNLPEFAQRIYTTVMPKPEVGARTSLYLATSPEVIGVSGRYFVDSKVKQPSALAQNEQLADRLWLASAALAKMETI
jgi:NAD(P)-dependent dehydrogenase (short-subunit alcohol dehydrogenase family)